MKLLSTIFLGTALALSSISAKDMDMAKSASSKTSSNLLKQEKSVDGYKIVLNSSKPLTVGSNDIDIKILKDSKPIDAKVKVKFFMPEMPGMPYMESKVKDETIDGVLTASINLAMGGTWQYIVKFKTEDGEVHKIRGSINL